MVFKRVAQVLDLCLRLIHSKCSLVGYCVVSTALYVSARNSARSSGVSKWIVWGFLASASCKGRC